LIRVSITADAFDAVCATLPLGSVDYAELTVKGERLIWLEAAVVNRLTALGGPGESYSDVILRLVEIEANVTSPSARRCFTTRRSFAR
jgi:hypothetical protein